MPCPGLCLQYVIVENKTEPASTSAYAALQTHGWETTSSMDWASMSDAYVHVKG